MSAPALALTPVLPMTGTGTGASTRTLDDELLDRASRDDYDAMARHHARGRRLRPPDPAPRHPPRHRPRDRRDPPRPRHRRHSRQGDLPAVRGPPRLGLPALRRDLPRRHLPAHPRRARGGKGMPESVAIHPCVFATFTAPSFGPVHTRAVTPAGRSPVQAPAQSQLLPARPAISCGQRHKEDDACLGRPLCPDCYDYTPRRLERPRLRAVAAHRHHSCAALDKLAKTHGIRVRLSYAKVAEFQRRGLIHFHAIFRLDGIDPSILSEPFQPHPALTANVLAEAHPARLASATWFATVPHPAKPNGWDITLGQPGRPPGRPPDRGRPDHRRRGRLLPGQVRDQDPPSRSASRPAGSLPRTPPSTRTRAPTRDGSSRACLKTRPPFARGLQGAAPLGTHARLPRPLRHQEPPLLHHHASASRRPPGLATPPAPRHRAPGRQDRHHPDRPQWAGRGWRTTGDALLALSAAARAREHRRVAREETAMAI